VPIISWHQLPVRELLAAETTYYVVQMLALPAVADMAADVACMFSHTVCPQGLTCSASRLRPVMSAITDAGTAGGGGHGGQRVAHLIRLPAGAGRQRRTGQCSGSIIPR